MIELSRRSLLKGSAGLAASSLFAKEAPPVETPLTQVRYGAVQLHDGPLKRQFDGNHQFFLNLSEDRLLKIYRQRAGLPAPGENMGGWYDDFCPGAHFGQYVSALVRFGAATGSAETKAKAQRLVRGFAQTMDPSGKFFVDLRYPSYTYDKHVCMLMDAHSLINDPDAKAILRATTDAALPHMPTSALTSEEQKAWRPQLDETHTWDEPYTIAENLFIVSGRMGDRRYFDLGKRYLQDRVFFDPLAEGKNVLPGLHAYSHMNALSSGMQGYLQLGDKKYLRAITNAVDMIWADQSFATGGWGPNEAFVEPGKGKLAASLQETHRSFETPCGSYAHFKVMRYLLTLTRDSRYGDSMERVLYNTVLGAKPIRADGSSFYYSDYHVSGQKTYKRDIPGARYSWDHDGHWPCCSGTLPQVAADYTISSYFLARDGVYVNLFVPSRLEWTQGAARCSVIQKTEYPTANLITLQVETSSPAEFGLFLRVPAWAGPNSSVSINGKRVKTAVQPGSFLPLRRSWKTGDLVEYEIDQRVASVPIEKQVTNQVAIVRGPQVLFATGRPVASLTASDAANPKLVKGSGYDWTLQSESGTTVVRPFYAIGDESYETYWNVNS